VFCVTTGAAVHIAYVFKVVSWLPSTNINVEGQSSLLMREDARHQQEEIVRCIREEKPLPLRISKEQAIFACYSVKSEAAKVARAALHEVC